MSMSFWSFVDSSLIGNHTTSFLYIQLHKLTENKPVSLYKFFRFRRKVEAVPGRDRRRSIDKDSAKRVESLKKLVSKLQKTF